MSTTPTKPSHITRIGLAAALLMPLGMSGVSVADDSVKTDVAAAVAMLSATAESQSNRVMKAFALVKRHDNAPALAQLIGWLDAEKATERRSAVYMIQMLPWKDASPAWPDLRRLMSHSEAMTRGMAAMALASTGDAQSYAKVVALMKDDKDPYARRCAAWAVGEIGDLKGLEDLKAALTDENALVKANAQNAIDRLTLVRDHADASGDVAKIVRGVWLISGSVMSQKQRIDRAVAMIRSANEPTRSEMLDKLKKSNSQAIRNSASLASQRVASPE